MVARLLFVLALKKSKNYLFPKVWLMKKQKIKEKTMWSHDWIGNAVKTDRIHSHEDEGGKCNLTCRNSIISAIYMRPQLCISMPEHERNFVCLILVWKTSGLLNNKTTPTKRNFWHLYVWHLSFFPKLQILIVCWSQRERNKHWKPINCVTDISVCKW